MLRLFNTYGRKLETFRPVRRDLASVFTCGPSTYQRVHLGNFRTFIFEDILVRYLEYIGYKVKRGMNITDIEDKAIEEARRQKTTVRRLTDRNLQTFLGEMDLLRISRPDFLPLASETVDECVNMIEELLRREVAYWYRDNVYFDPLKFPGFGKLYGLDMSRWPARKRRFHRDTYPGIQWNLGDFILWHGYRQGDLSFWNTRIGKGRPSWNVQDPAMVLKYFDETLSLYCGGIDNLFRHHDYSLAILESVRPRPMARFWLHCRHLYVMGKKMSKSKGNIYYIDTLLDGGHRAEEIRFFLIYGHYRERMDYSDEAIADSSERLRSFRRLVGRIERKAAARPDHRVKSGGEAGHSLRESFGKAMDDDLDVRSAFDAVDERLSAIDEETLRPEEASGIIRSLREIDSVLQVIF